MVAPEASDRNPRACFPGPRAVCAARGLATLVSPAMFVLAAAVAVMLAIGYVGLRQVERQVRTELEGRLNTAAVSSELALRTWLGEQANIARSWAAEPETRAAILRVAAAPANTAPANTTPANTAPDRQPAEASPELARLREMLRPICSNHEYATFFILDRQGRVIAALRDDVVGKPLPPAAAAVVRRAAAGETAIAPPFRQSFPLPDDTDTAAHERSAMLVATPVRDPAETIAAVLAFCYRPEKKFSAALEVGRPGASGETYALDPTGLFLTDSRFNAQLRDVGLLPNDPASRATLALRARDPGGNLLEGFRPAAARDRWPPTRMAASLSRGESGVDLAGYRDYRGVPVIGAWRWLPEYGFGLAHEIDVADAYAPVRGPRWVFASWLALMLLALGVSTAWHIRWRRAQQHSRQTEAALNTADDWLRRVLNSATQVSIIATDMDGLITVFNTGAERMLGYSAAEVVGKLTPRAIHVEREVQEHGARLSGHFGRTITGFEVFVQYARQGSHEEREWTYKRKDGSLLTVNLVVTALLDAQGKMTGFLGIAKDVTAGKEAERAMREAKEAAEAANRAKSEFLAKMSHEIRTPLNGIVGATALALESRPSQEQREFLEIIRHSTDHLLVVVNDILDFSKIEAGKMELSPAPFYLPELVETCVAALAYPAHERNVELLHAVESNVPDHVVGDVHCVRQVLINLVNNAVKFTLRGQVTTRVWRVGPGEDGGGENGGGEDGGADAGAREQHAATTDNRVWLRFEVGDTGVGIAPEQLSKLFQPFVQADNSATRTYGGTGLGLVICKRLVELMGGTIHARSTPGVGSTFWFELPFAPAPAPAPGAAPESRLNLAGFRALLVDDVQVNLSVLRGLLARVGLETESASSGRQALALLAAGDQTGRPFDLVLLDCMMPEMDGFALAAHIRAVPGHVETPLIMLTSDAHAHEDPRRETLGFAAFIHKPIFRHKLYKAVKQALCPSDPAPTWPEAPTSRRRPLRVLVAEDNPVNQVLARRALEKRGHQVVCAADGRDAVARFREDRFDLVLMDIEMPHMDGKQATLAMRDMEKKGRTRTPIIAFSAHAFNEHREQYLSCGMDDHLAKPLQPRDLLAMIERHAWGGLSDGEPEYTVADESPETTASAEPGEAGAPGPRGDSTADHVWRTVALQYVGGDEEELRNTIALFREDAPQQQDGLRRALADDNHRETRRFAHTLKGHGRLFGDLDLEKVARELEELAARQFPPPGHPTDQLYQPPGWDHERATALANDLGRRLEALLARVSPVGDGRSVEARAPRLEA